MSAAAKAAALTKFLNAFDTLKKNHICGVCRQICKDPVVLKECFHWVCAEHTNLKYCPNCDITFDDDAETFVDDKLVKCIEITTELDAMFETLRPQEASEKRTRKVVESSTKASKAVDMAAKTLAKSKTAKTDDVSTKTVNTKLLSDKANTQPNLSETLGSNVSSIIKSNEKRNTKGETALHVACRLGKIDKIKELLSSGANTNTKDNAGWTPLHEVVQNGRLDLVKLLLQYNTLINVPGQSNETPLHEAIRFNHVEIAQELVKNGADIYIRNCKGETPYQLASSDMKNTLLVAADNIIQTQGVNISNIVALNECIELDNIHIYCVSEYHTVHNKVKMLAKHHNNIFYEAKFSKKVTHMIVNEENGICASTFDVLQGIVSNIWIISSEWATKSTKDKLEPFHPYEITGVGAKSNNGPRNSRYNKYKQLPGIFDGCHFYLHNFNMKYEISKSLVLSKATLTKLITDAGGIVLRRVPNPELIPDNEILVPYHARKDGKLYNCSHYIIFKDMYEPMYNMQHLKALPVGWLIECIEKYEFCEPW